MSWEGGDSINVRFSDKGLPQQSTSQSPAYSPSIPHSHLYPQNWEERHPTKWQPSIKKPDPSVRYSPLNNNEDNPFTSDSVGASDIYDECDEVSKPYFINQGRQRTTS